MQLNFSCPDEIVKELDKHVDGVRYRNRAQLMTTIFAEWLDGQFVRGLKPPNFEAATLDGKNSHPGMKR
jgi:hypothetical protein